MPPKIRKEGAGVVGMLCGVEGDRAAVMTRKPRERRLRSCGEAEGPRVKEEGEKACQAGDHDGWMGLRTGFTVGRETLSPDGKDAVCWWLSPCPGEQ